MENRFGWAGRLGAAALVLASGLAWAHAHLEVAVPAEGSKSGEVAQISLTFSEPIEVKLSSIRLETLDERAVVEPAAQAVAGAPGALAVQLHEKLPAGQYRVRWAVVATDGHRMKGSYTFLVSR